MSIVSSLQILNNSFIRYVIFKYFLCFYIMWDFFSFFSTVSSKEQKIFIWMNPNFSYFSFFFLFFKITSLLFTYSCLHLWIRYHNTQVANIRPIVRIWPSILFYLDWHLVSTWWQHGILA